MTEVSFFKTYFGGGGRGKDCAHSGRGLEGAKTALPGLVGGRAKDCYIMFYNITEPLREYVNTVMALQACAY